MLETAQDYANFFKHLDVNKQITPINSSIDEMLKRLDELEALMNTVKTDASTTTEQNLPEIFQSKFEFHKLCQNIDSLGLLVATVSDNMDELEHQIVEAEDELGINDLGIKGLLKPLFSKNKKKPETAYGNEVKPYQPIAIFKPSDYFGESSAGEPERM